MAKTRRQCLEPRKTGRTAKRGCRTTASQISRPAGQEHMTREITKLQAIGQYILYKNSEPSGPKPVPGPSRARTAH